VNSNSVLGESWCVFGYCGCIREMLINFVLQPKRSSAHVLVVTEAHVSIYDHTLLNGGHVIFAECE